LGGQDWREALPVLPAGKRYADHIDQAAQGLGQGLLGHAYVRYLGDLNGGQVLSRLLAKSLDLPPEALTFYRFPMIENLEGFRLGYRAALDRCAKHLPQWSTAIDAAAQAFALNIEVSEAVTDTLAERALGRG
jgi:heme oxygenase